MSEETERSWFRRVVTVIMLAGFCVGMQPYVKNWIWPQEKTRR